MTEAGEDLVEARERDTRAMEAVETAEEGGREQVEGEDSLELQGDWLAADIGVDTWLAVPS